MRPLDDLLRDPTRSTYRESLLEAIFVSELVQVAWVLGYEDVEVARAFVDFKGYDLIATSGDITRHIQLKGVRQPRIKMHRGIELKESGCCVLLRPRASGKRIEMRYQYFGPSPGGRLVFADDVKVAKGAHWVKRDGKTVKPEKENHVVVPRSRFSPAEPAHMEDLIPLLLGPAPGISGPAVQGAAPNLPTEV